MRRFALIALAASVSLFADVEDRMNKSVPAQPGGRLVLEAEMGAIRVEPGSSNSIEVEVYRRVDAPSREESDRILKDFELEVIPQGSEVRMRGVFKTGWRPQSEMRNGGWRRMCRNGKCLEYARYLREFEYRVKLPKQFSVDLHTSGGSIHVGDLNGEVKAGTSGGSLTFGRIDGPIFGRTSGGSINLTGGNGKADVRTSGGSIHIGEVSGDVNAHTSGGSIHIDRATGSVIARTSGGSVTVRETTGAIDASTSGGNVTAFLLAQPKQDCKLSTSGGTINVHLASNIGVAVDASTSGGSVSTDFPVTISGRISRRELKAAVNGGGPLLHLRTSGGGINLKRA